MRRILEDIALVLIWILLFAIACLMTFPLIFRGRRNAV